MSIKTVSLRVSALALLTAVAVSASVPAIAAPRTVPEASQPATDISAARRTHHAKRQAVRNAYGAYDGRGAAGTPAPLPYGNGVGDNSRNQTW